jgi:hypothetical protein
MKHPAFGLDENGRSHWTEIEIPLREVSALHAISDKQPAAYWGISLNQPTPAPDNIQAMALTNEARIVWVMGGHLEVTTQDGDTRRWGSGIGNFVHGKGLHHSSMKSPDTVTLSLTFAATEGYPFPQK